MAGIEEEIKELVSRDDTSALSTYNRVEKLSDPGDTEASSGTIHIIESLEGNITMNLPEPPKAASSLIMVKLGVGVTNTVTLTTESGEIDINGSPNKDVPGAPHSLVELVSDGENYHVIGEINNV
jgi:hypothetical protein